MKKMMLFLLTFLAVSAFAAEKNLGTFDPDCGSWFVDTGKIRCEFFEGTLFPTGFRNKNGYYPNFSMLDRITVGGKKFYLKDEHWGKIRILTNTSEKFEAECNGYFCALATSRFTLCPDAEICCRTTLERGSGKVVIQTTVTLKKGSVVKYELMKAGWKGIGFPEVVIDGKSRKHGQGILIDIPKSGAILRGPNGFVRIPMKASLFASHQRYDKGSRLFQYIQLPGSTGEMKQGQSISAKLELEFLD